MINEVEYWKELMAVFRQARGHYAQIVSFSLASIVAAIAIAFQITETTARQAIFLVATLCACGATFMHLIFLKETAALREQILQVQPKIGDCTFDSTSAVKSTLLASLVVFT